MYLFRWNKLTFSRKYELFIDEKLIGEIIGKPLSSITFVLLNGNKYIFETEGLVQKQMLIIDMQKKESIGTIKFNFFKTKATIHLLDSTYAWKPSNRFNTGWKMFDNEMLPLINTKSYKGDSQQIAKHSNALLIICGIICLFNVRNMIS